MNTFFGKGDLLSYLVFKENTRENQAVPYKVSPQKELIANSTIDFKLWVPTEPLLDYNDLIPPIPSCFISIIFTYKL